MSDEAMDHWVVPAGLDDVPYWLMDGAGNNFVILDLRESGRLTESAAAALGDRSGPFAADQIITINGSADHPHMDIWNADGSQAGACGNASRCVAWLAMRETGAPNVTITTPSGDIEAALDGPSQVTVDMGPPKLDWEDIPLAEQMDDTRFIDIKLGPIDNPVLWGPSAVNMGNPHCVFFVKDLDAHQLDRFGPLVENHPLFPERANVTIAKVIDRETIEARTWERGVGLTAACGTAACATLVSAVRRRLTERAATVKLAGGDLRIEWRADNDHVMMTGPISLNGQGRF